MRSSAHPPRLRARWPAVPATQRLPGPLHPSKVKYSWKQQQSTMRAVRQVQERLLGPPPQSLATWQSDQCTHPPRNGNLTQDHAWCHSCSERSARESCDKQVPSTTTRSSSQQAQMYEPDPEDINSWPFPPKSNAFPRQARARSEMANGTTSGSSEESDCENPERPSSWLLKDGLKTHLHQHHLMRRRLNVQDYFLPGPAHPPKKWQCCQVPSCDARSRPGPSQDI